MTCNVLVWSNLSFTTVRKSCVKAHSDILTRFTDQGLTPALSKIWMPLDQFTKLTMESLIHGDPEIAVGFAATYFDKFEKGKREQAEQNIGKIPTNKV